MQGLFSKSWKVLVALTFLSMLMRFFSFFPSVINHDESTYILIADAMRHGQIYLRDVIDTKPIGIFALFAIFQTLFGKTVLLIRIITAVWVAITGWMIYLIHRRLQPDSPDAGFNVAPVASGVIYVFIMSIYTDYGISPNTEIFFALFTATGLWLMLRSSAMAWFLVSGLLMGLGFMIKYVVAFDAIALGFFYMWLQIRNGKSWSYTLWRCVMMGIGFFAPFLATLLYYYHLNMVDIFLFFSFELSGRYFQDAQWFSYWKYVLDGLLRYFVITFWFFYSLRNWRMTGPLVPVLGIWWGGLVMIIILLPGKLFGHYFIQFLLPFSLLAGNFFDYRMDPGKSLAWMRKASVGFPILALLIVVNTFFQKKDYYDKRDYPKEIAAFLNAQLKPGDLIYTGDFHPITYLLTHTQSPTPYIHRSLLWTKENSDALQIQPKEEWTKILNQRPRFIITYKQIEESEYMQASLQKSYRMIKLFGTQIKLYERNPSVR